MEFIQHSINWVKGEILEGVIVVSFGILTLISSILFWRFGKTLTTKGMIIPLLVIGIFYFIAASVSIYINQQRIPQYEEKYQENPAGFIESERERTEGFMKIYIYSYVIATVMIFTGLILFLFIGGANFKGIGLSLILMGLSLLCIDYFSKERAIIYHNEIIRFLNK
jgi:hypothetical protein